MTPIAISAMRFIRTTKFTRLFPITAKSETHITDRDRPADRAGKTENHEGGKRHAQNTRQNSSENPRPAINRAAKTAHFPCFSKNFLGLIVLTF